ncbi:SSY5 [Candida theae]|uniref:SSY5 n=1 Tax=Candida theae TaxID=1198502 RepID=A0AAD5BHR8_9ASCO|nr:SSY5 [Candida theae]KAI5964430.1 SSY5 [Candida theae]
MRRFLSRANKADDDADLSQDMQNSRGQGQDDAKSRTSSSLRPTKSNISHESYDSVRELRPMFGGVTNQQPSSVLPSSSSSSSSSHNPSETGFFDTGLNLNPSIMSPNDTTTIGPSSSKHSTTQGGGGSSLFSSKQSFSTKQSSYQSTNTAKRPFQYNYSQPLQVLDLENSDNRDERSYHDRVCDALKKLSQDLAYILMQYNSSSVNISTTVVSCIDCFKEFNSSIREKQDSHISTCNNLNLRKIVKYYLHFYDNLLKNDVYIKLRLLLVKHFNDFASMFSDNASDNNVIVKPQNFAIGADGVGHFPNQDSIARIMDRIARTNTSVSEQNGSFIAPIMRGVSLRLSILCLYFGYPDPQDMHYKLTQSIHDVYEDIHVVVVRNQIEPASAKVQNTPPARSISTGHKPLSSSPIHKFKLPFRVPTDPLEPPISISISTESSNRVSGTMGGYVYPKIDLTKQPQLKSYASSKFAISCGHVCLDPQDSSHYCNIASPSAALISLYKSALTAQYQRQAGQSSDSHVAYGAILNELEEMFPLKKVKVQENHSAEHYEMRNLPQVRFGQIIWGERTLINLSETPNEISGLVERKLSDLAIIKVNKHLKCSYNYLGDDVQFNEYDPALILDNLYVRKVLNFKRFKPRTIKENIDEVDSDLSSTSSQEESSNYNGIPVFKYGSTTKYTRGNLNGIKLVYWLDGAMHSSEFIVNSIEHNSAFASGGDSGSWVLAKLQDLDSNASGLGVLGMLHSYDGEFKQFGLFTPMCEILNRLEEVTNIKWGVVGCEEVEEDKKKSGGAMDHRVEKKLMAESEVD